MSSKLNLKRLDFFNIKVDVKEKLLEIYNKLFEAFGPQHWWPAETKDEVIIGAVLTQNTAWTNVERAISNLRRLGLLNLRAIAKADLDTLKEAIRPAGFFNQKAQYLKNVAEFFVKHGGIVGLSQIPTDKLRDMLLDIKGIGKETADSILLYTFERPVFVVDAYTKRLVKRHELSQSLTYDDIQGLFINNLPLDVQLFNEYHALIVRLAKTFCKSKPNCKNCPLEDL